MTPILHAKIAEQAYLLWLNDGMSHGKAEHHWSLAETLVAQPKAADFETAATPVKKSARKKAASPRAARIRRTEAALHS